MTKEQKIKEFLESELTDDGLVQVWNDYCAIIDCCCDTIYDMGDFNLYYCGCDPMGVALRLFNSTNFNPHDHWFVIDGYNNPVSTNFPIEYINTVNLAEYIIEYDYDFWVGEIREILDSDSED